MGLARTYWVPTKLVLTLVLATAAVVSLRPSLNQAAAKALAVYKPWGQTRFQRR